MKGIDVSKWQGIIDWLKVKVSGIQYAILKVTAKGNGIEESFARNYAGCIANGILVGVYRYVYAKTVAEAQAEAYAIVNALKGKKIRCGVWLDLEDASIKGLGKAQLSKIINAEAEILRAAGYKVGIYSNLNWYNNVLDGKELAKTFPFWMARYPLIDTGKIKESLSPKAYAGVVAWQYSSKGKVPGINGNVDMDVSFVDLVQLMDSDNTVNDIYYPKYMGTSPSIVVALQSLSIDSSYTFRKKIAAVNNITGYTGTASQNTHMLNLLKAGKLKKA